MNLETIKNFISNTVFKSKKIDSGILQALAITAGIEDHTGRNAFQAIKDIAENTPNEVYNNLLPLSVKTGTKAAADVLFDFISKSDTRLALTGVYSDKERGLYCATDAKYMAIAPMPENIQNTLEKSIITDKNGNKITAVYPDYFRIIPQNCRNSIKLDSLYLYAGFVGSLCNFNACFFDNPNKTPVNISGVEFQPDLLLNALQAFCKCGCNSVTMEYNTPEYPVMFTAANGLKVIAMPLRGKNNGGFSFPVHARVNVLTDDAQLHNFSLDHRKINAGGNEFFGTCKNPLYGVKYSVSQAEIEKLDLNIHKNYRDVISRIANGAVNLVYDPKTKNLDGLNISGYLKDCNYTVASERTAAEHKFFVDTVKSVKTPDDCKKALPLLLEWMRIINDYVANLEKSGWKSDYSGKIAKFPVEYFEKVIFENCKKNITDGKITPEYAESLFYGGRDRYNAISELANNTAAELEKKEKEMQAAIPADSGIYIKQVTGSDGNIELYYQHEKCGWNLYKTIEDLQREKQAIELQYQERKQVAELAKAKSTEKPKNNCCSCIVLDSGIKQISEDTEKTQNNADTSDIKPDAVNHTLERLNAAGTPKNNEKHDIELDNLPYWNKAKELCTVSSGTLANLLNCDKYSVIARVESEWQEYIARNGTTADNWQKCWQEFQQSEDYNYLALIHGLPLPPPDERKPDISGSSGNDRPDKSSGIASNADAELPPDDTTPLNVCARAYEHTDCHCKPPMQASSCMRMHTGKHTDCPPDKSNVTAPCMRAGIHTDQHQHCSDIASIAFPAAVPDG